MAKCPLRSLARRLGVRSLAMTCIQHREAVWNVRRPQPAASSGEGGQASRWKALINPDRRPGLGTLTVQKFHGPDL